MKRKFNSQKPYIMCAYTSVYFDEILSIFNGDDLLLYKKYFARWSILEGFGEITNNIMNLRIEARDNDVITFYSFNSN